MKFKTRKKVANVLAIVSGASLGVFGVGLGEFAGAQYVDGTPIGDKPIGKCVFRILGIVGGGLIVMPIAHKIDEKLNEWVCDADDYKEFMSELNELEDQVAQLNKKTEAE